jgi:acetyl esterase/lipase
VLHTPNGAVRWTYARLWDRAAEVARSLRACGVGKDSRVGILMTNRPEWIAAFFGVGLAGGVAVALSTFSTLPELKRHDRDAVRARAGNAAGMISVKISFRGVAAVLIAAACAALLGCSAFSFFVANAPNALGSFRRTADLSYGDDARQKLDVYAPRRPDHRPVVIFFYGGTWSAGKKSNYAFVGAALAERGYVTVIPDYRLYPRVRFPTFVEDGARAVAWVQQHARDFGGDPDRLVLMGHSAGAHIAALLALNPSYLAAAGVRPHSIAGLIGLSGPYALVPDTATLHAIFGPPYTPSDWQPVHFADRTAPPTLLLHGADDKVVYSAHTEKLRDALLSQGVEVETHVYPGRGHADTIASFTVVARYRTPALKQSLTFLGRITAGVRPSPGE